MTNCENVKRHNTFKSKKWPVRIQNSVTTDPTKNTNCEKNYVENILKIC